MRALIRATAFLRKEIVEILRQPTLVVSLVIGPFVILLAFGAGLQTFDPPVSAIVVGDERAPLAEAVQRVADAEADRLRLIEVTSDRSAALARLLRGDVDLVLELPDEPLAAIRSGERATIVLYHHTADPVENEALGLLAESAVSRLNRTVVQAAVAQLQRAGGRTQQALEEARASLRELRTELARADAPAAAASAARARERVGVLAVAAAPLVGILDGLAGADGEADPLAGRLQSLSAGAQAIAENPSAATPADLAALERDLDAVGELADDFTDVDAGVLTSPFAGVIRRVVDAPLQPRDFYAPAVIVLLLQHMTVTFISLSLVREEQLGTMELFRVAPLTPLELLVGKYLAYLVVGGAVGALLTGLLVLGLSVPMVAGWAAVAGVLALVVVTSIGLGFVLALLARTDTKAVQYAMLVLLASVFLSGFILSLERFSTPVAVLARALPATHGIALLRQTMLGGAGDQAPLWWLAGYAVALSVAAGALLRRRLDRG